MVGVDGSDLAKVIPKANRLRLHMDVDDKRPKMLHCLK